ncbi:hypothetical protein [Teredinibacter waterburyi]|jgi:hypothetical protein|uniref:hypothetical protein n=1 Tax=Teredinibacter waterburyi TaxID=1500538 RepID=UPI00165F5B6C|nr:hypothetical protein [Teredinibacter waterburyi]
MNAIKQRYETLIDKYRVRLRDKAISRARARIYASGKEPEALSEVALEAVVKDEEDKLVSELKSKGIYALLAALGLSFWV